MLSLFKKPIVSQSEFTAGRAVSVWVGDFRDEEAFDAYLREEKGFAADFGFKIDDRSGPEISVEQREVGIRQLLTGFSIYEQFIDAAVQRAEEKKISGASAAAVFHFVSYPDSAIRSQKHVRFLGCFPVDGFK